MSHDTHTDDTSIKDLDAVGGELASLLKLVKGWKDPFPPPIIKEHDGIQVVREDLLGCGSKARFASHYISKLKEDTLVYIAPRVGWAPLSLAHLAKLYNKRLVLFAPAAANLSCHQAAAVVAGGEMRFCRIAAMPPLRVKVREWADRHGYCYLPMGLDVPEVTAAIAKTAIDLTKRHGEPDVVWTAVSTGVLTRGLQLGWPNADMRGVAVARNLKAGEKGRTTLISHDQPFQQAVKKQHMPPFDSAINYDAKCIQHIRKENYGNKSVWFWNVGGEPTYNKEDKRLKKLNPNVAWGDETCFKAK